MSLVVPQSLFSSHHSTLSPKFIPLIFQTNYWDTSFRKPEREHVIPRGRGQKAQTILRFTHFVCKTVLQVRTEEVPE